MPASPSHSPSSKTSAGSWWHSSGSSNGRCCRSSANAKIFGGKAISTVRRQPAAVWTLCGEFRGAAIRLPPSPPRCCVGRRLFVIINIGCPFTHIATHGAACCCRSAGQLSDAVTEDVNHLSHPYACSWTPSGGGRLRTQIPACPPLVPRRIFKHATRATVLRRSAARRVRHVRVYG